MSAARRSPTNEGAPGFEASNAFSTLHLSACLAWRCLARGKGGRRRLSKARMGEGGTVVREGDGGSAGGRRGLATPWHLAGAAGEGCCGHRASQDGAEAGCATE